MTIPVPEIPAAGRIRPRLLLLSAYDAGSHARWRKLLVSALPEYEWHTLTLPPRYFRWRIRGNPLSWFNEPLLAEHWDGLVVTTMVDLATLRGLKPALACVPTLAYCHENQFAYPQQAHARVNIEPQMVNLYTLLAAERVVFNSAWNRDSFFSGLESLLGQLPDRKPADLSARIARKCAVIPVPIDDGMFQARSHKALRPAVIQAVPHLLWNHRWEHDKAPERLLLMLRALRDIGFCFRLSVVGERFRQAPEAFTVIENEFADAIVNWGFIRSGRAYRQLLAEADLVLSTAVHDFQGLAVLEAMAAGAYPWVPDRLAYSEYVPGQFRYASLEADSLAEARGAAVGLQTLWQQILADKAGPVSPESYRYSRLIPLYRRELEELLLS